MAILVAFLTTVILTFQGRCGAGDVSDYLPLTDDYNANADLFIPLEIFQPSGPTPAMLEQLNNLTERIHVLEEIKKKSTEFLVSFEKQLIELEKMAMARRQRRMMKDTLFKSGGQAYAECGEPPRRAETVFTLNETKTGLLANYTCKKGYANVGGLKNISTCGASRTWTPVSIHCTNFATCAVKVGRRVRYNGTINVTVTGYPCQRWNSHKPHTHVFQNSNDFAFMKTTGLGYETIEEAANSCRDPGNIVAHGYLWCYSLNPTKKKEKCNVPMCDIPK